MFCTTQRICAIGTSWRKSGRKRGNSFGNIALFWTRRFQKLKTGTNGRSIVWTHERYWNYFWMNDPSIAHSRQVRLPKSKSLLVGELPTRFWKRTFKNISSCNTPPPWGMKVSVADFRSSPHKSIIEEKSQGGQQIDAVPHFLLILPSGTQADPQADNPKVRRS